jgi:hypothetical protein
VYVQWHRRDNAGRVEIMRLQGDEIQTEFVKGTETSIRLRGLLSFSSASVRGPDVYRVRPEQGVGLCRHTAGQEKPEALCAAASVCPIDSRPGRFWRARRKVIYRAADRR